MFFCSFPRLRNLEVNTLERFVGLSAREPGPFSNGLMSRELLLASTMAMRKATCFVYDVVWRNMSVDSEEALSPCDVNSPCQTIIEPDMGAESLSLFLSL